MINVRTSPDERNRRIDELAPMSGERNVAWVRRTGIRDGVLLLGGCSLVEFRIRFAQARVRRDLLPSFWSMVGLLWDGASVKTVADLRDLDRVPYYNGVQTVPLEEFDDPGLYPNIAILQFTKQHTVLREHLDAIETQRSVVDIPALIVPWLAYVWVIGTQGNPRVEGKGLPSAALIETAHAMAGVDLTPGLASSASCPEAIWQAAVWWAGYYEKAAADRVSGRAAADRVPGPAPAIRPVGAFACRQREAHVVDRETPRPPAARRAKKKPARRAKR